MIEKFFLRFNGAYLDRDGEFTVRFMTHEEACQFSSVDEAVARAIEMGLDLKRIKVLKSRYFWNSSKT